MSLPNDLPAAADELAAQAREVARKVGDQISEKAANLGDSASTARYLSEEFIRGNPWPSMGLAMAFGFVLGIVMARR